MKKKNNKIIIVFIVCVLLLISLGFVCFNVFYKNSNSLTLEENKWLDENKYNVVDIALFNDIPVLSYDGEGIIYEYLDYITRNTMLKFNVVSYKLDSNIEYENKIEIVESVNEKQISLLGDNFVLITKDDVQYSNINDIENLKIGVLSSDKQSISDYMNNQTNTFVEYNTYTDLKNSISSTTITEGEETNSTSEVDAIVILKTIFLKEYIENDFNIAYQFNDLNRYFVLNVNSSEKLNSIFLKNYNNWKEEDFAKKYNEELLSSYFRFKQLSDVDQKNLNSKNYVYGFVEYGVFNYLDGSKLSGINGLILKDFKDFSGLSISYTKYNSINKLITDFNSDKVDFVFDVIKNNSLKEDVYSTVDVFDKDLVIVSHVSNNIVASNVKSLRNSTVLTLKDSYLEDYLNANNIKYVSYNNMEDLTKDYSESDVVVVDLENYNYYKTSSFKDSRILISLDFEDKYNYVINNNKNNKTFGELFNFYLAFNNINKLIAQNYESIAYENINITLILILIIIVLVIYLALDFYNHMRVMIKANRKNKAIKMSKEDKIKYIDQLTSLKNRAYLNSKIETWDNSEVYPQSIIVIDLNNVSYINDNYGREEGDKVITEAANILIQHQLANTEIIRTDGNEFLVYMVGYNEKQIVSYLRKLNKEFKNLSHGFGAASGYSIITDAIKTIDDAVNEATLEMKENKEDIEY